MTWNPKKKEDETITIDLTKITDIVLDTGILLTYLSDRETESTKWLEQNLFIETAQIKIHSHEINQTEIFYLTCREQGIDEAKKVIKDLSDYILFHNEPELNEIAGTLKCKHSIALADCYAIATGKWLKCPILFKKETELTQSKIDSLKKEFNVELIIFNS